MKPVHQTARRGSVLIVAMLIVFAIASLVLALGRTARTEGGIGANELAARQAEMVERGAEQYVLALLSEQLDSLADLTEQDFAQVPVGTGYFWIVRPDYGDNGLPAYGLVDESSKLHLNSANYDKLRALEGMTDEIAASIIDWRDEDDAPTQSGSESQAYLSRSDPYRAKNAAFEAVEELLLVQGMNRELLYGQPVINSGSAFNQNYQRIGLYDYFTAWNTRPNTTADGTARVNLRDFGARQQLSQLLNDKLGQTRGTEVLTALGLLPVVDIFDFANRARLQLSELEALEDYITTTNPQGQLRGRINVNEAPREVLMCLSNVTSGDVDSLLSRRPTAVQNKPDSVAWVYDVLKERSVGLGDQICGQGRQFSADIVGVSGNGRAFKRVRAVFDCSGETPRIVYRRDITELGFPLDQGILQTLRQGGVR